MEHKRSVSVVPGTAGQPLPRLASVLGAAQALALTLTLTLTMAAAGHRTACAAELAVGESRCAATSGDVNADSITDLSDAITVLGHLFLGSPAELPPLCQGQKRLPDTGQTRCYDDLASEVDCADEDWPGQDAHHTTGCPAGGRFVDHGDGTVTDTCTGLMWQKGTADLDGDGRVTARVTSTPSPDEVNWQAALRYCEDLQLAGHSDWRLPNVRELLSLVDFERRYPAPAIDPVLAAQPAKHWTSTTSAIMPTWAIQVTFYASSELWELEKSGSAFVLAVRRGCTGTNGDIQSDGAVDVSDAVSLLGFLFLGSSTGLPATCAAGSGLPDTGQTTCYDSQGNAIDCADTGWPGQDGAQATGCSPEERFVDHGDGTVTDTCTRLMWQRSTADVDGDGVTTPDGLDGLSWQQALAFCDDLQHAGYSDWRLPNARELESLVDYGRLNPCTDPVFAVETVRHWSSSNLEPAGELGDRPNAAGFVAFTYGGRVYHASKDRRWLVLAVRDAP